MSIVRPDDMERITTPELAKKFIDEQVVKIKEQVGDGKVLLALSGGVDSSVVAALLIKAIGRNLVCVHVNHGLLRKGEPEQVALTNVDCGKYFSMIEKLREKYKDKIAVKAGMEFGVQTHTIPEYEKLFRSYPFDFIILSIHQAGDQEFWTNEYQSGRTQQEYNEGYYKELLSVVQNYHNYSVLGHMDLIVRYDSYGVYPFEKLKPLLTEILKTVIADGKGIEVNTSNHRYGLSDMTPSRDILKLYKELGGTIITIGSDSHKKEHLGAYIDWAKEELRKLGYTQFCTFEKMQPIFHEL
mgnify:CR=1 FL=1